MGEWPLTPGRNRNRAAALAPRASPPLWGRAHRPAQTKWRGREQGEQGSQLAGPNVARPTAPPPPIVRIRGDSPTTHHTSCTVQETEQLKLGCSQAGNAVVGRGGGLGCTASRPLLRGERLPPRPIASSPAHPGQRAARVNESLKLKQMPCRHHEGGLIFAGSTRCECAHGAHIRHSSGHTRRRATLRNRMRDKPGTAHGMRYQTAAVTKRMCSQNRPVKKRVQPCGSDLKVVFHSFTCKCPLGHVAPAQLHFCGVCPVAPCTTCSSENAAEHHCHWSQGRRRVAKVVVVPSERGGPPRPTSP